PCSPKNCARALIIQRRIAGVILSLVVQYSIWPGYKVLQPCGRGTTESCEDRIIIEFHSNASDLREFPGVEARAGLQFCHATFNRRKHGLFHGVRLSAPWVGGWP